MIGKYDIVRMVEALGSGQVSLLELEQWIVPASRNMHKDSLPEAIALAAAILSLFSEYGEGDLNERELRLELANALRPFALRYVYAWPEEIVWGRRPSRSADSNSGFPVFAQATVAA